MVRAIQIVREETCVCVYMYVCVHVLVCVYVCMYVLMYDYIYVLFVCRV